MSENFDENSFWNKIKKYAKKAGKEVIEKVLWLYYAAQNPEAPMRAKATIYAALAYFVLPIDAIPDLIPVAGYGDDLSALAAAIATVSIYITSNVKELAKKKMADWFDCDSELEDNESDTSKSFLSSTQIRKIEELKKAHERGFLSDEELERELENIDRHLENSRNKIQEISKNNSLKYKNILRGQRLKLAEIVPDSSKFEIFSNMDSLELIIDFACFGLDLNGQLSDDRYMTFFNQPSTPCGGVIINLLENNAAKFTVDLRKLPDRINQLIFIAAIDGNTVMSQLANGHIKFIVNESETARFSFLGSDFSEERALILLTIYLKQNEWRTSAIGQGFYGGLEQLVHHFGGILV